MSSGPHRTPSLQRRAAHRLLALVLCAAAGAAAAQSYTFSFLPADGARFNSGLDINNAGQVVGVAGNTHEMMGVLWPSPTRSMVLPGTAICCTYITTSAFAINGAGRIVGSDTYRAALWTGTTPTLLPSLGGVQSGAHGLNDAGQAVGFTLFDSRPNSVTRATLWSGGQAFDLGTLGGASSQAHDINAHGWAVGASQRATGDSMHATLWRQGSAIDLGRPGDTESEAHAINDAGQIVGHHSNRAAMWQGTALTFLGGAGTRAADINAAGLVVGSTFDDLEDGVSRATLWNGRTALDLTSFLGQAHRDAGWTLETANAINDHGWITGSAFNHQTFERAAYLLAAVPAVPEPGTIGLWLVGLVVLWVAATRLRRREGEDLA